MLLFIDLGNIPGPVFVAACVLGSLLMVILVGGKRADSDDRDDATDS